MNRSISAVICAALLSSLMTACGDTSSDSKPADTSAADTAAATEETTAAAPEGGSVVLDSDNVKLVGRTYLIDDTLWCGFSGTGTEFEYTGTGLDITFKADTGFASEDSRARAAVYIDGERVLDEMLDMPTETFTVYEGESKTVDVKIVKLSETAQSTFGIMPIELEEGESIKPAAPKAHRIEFIGDSITCGYGVDDEVKEHHFATSTEDVTRAYAYKTAQALDADYSIVSISGYGIISGYTNDPNKKSESQIIPKYYEKLGFSYNKFAGTQAPQDIDWDFSQFIPEAIVINLGTNDESYVKGSLEKANEYVAGYVEFLKQVRSKNPDAEIFCALGVMGAGLYNNVLEATLNYTAETGDEKVHAVQLPTQDGSLGFAADWHPTEGTHELAAEVMSNEIKTVMGW